MDIGLVTVVAKFFHLKGFLFLRDYINADHNFFRHVLNTEDEFQKILTDHSGMIWRIVCNYEWDQQIGLELNQDIHFAIWEAIPKFKGNSTLKTFLARIAHNKCISHVAREAAKPNYEELDFSHPSDDPTPYDNTESSNRHDLLMRAVRRLPLGLQQVISLSLEGFTPKEISSILGENPNIISIRLTRAKTSLRHDLKELNK